MAVYQGARPRSIFLPPRPRLAEPPALPRRKVRGAVRAQRRQGRVGFTLGAIVLTFLLAFFSLAQTVRVSATSYDIDRLVSQREQLEARVRQLQSDLNRLGREPAIRKQSLDAGLGQLTEPLVIRAR
jgi:outer membrane murein-binding lipoprotein Lpp